MNPSSTSPEDVAALFDLPPELPPEPDDTAAAEAALAAELAATMAAGGVAGDAPDSRARVRVAVDWPARLTLPGGRGIVLQVRNISENGVGLASDEPIPAHALVDFEMAVPPLDEGGATTAVTGRIETTYTVAQGERLLFGGRWEVPPAGQELVRGWIRRLWR